MNDPVDVAKEVVTDAIAKTAARALDSDVGKSLLGPGSVEMGELIGKIASATNFYATRTLERVFKLWAAQRNNKPISEDEFKRVMPLLPTAALIQHEELQDLWATLLESFSTDIETLPSFGHTLSQLTPIEAKFLEAAWSERFFPKRSDGLRSIYYRTKWGTTDEWAEYNPDRKEGRLLLRLEFNVVLSDVMRLGILERNNTFSEEVNGELEELIAFSPYGMRFMRSIRGPRSDDEADGSPAA